MYSGGMLATVESLVELDYWDQIKIFTPLQRRRMLDSEYVAELVIGYLHWPQNKKDNLDHYFQLYAPVFPFEAEIKESFTATLDFLHSVFPEPRMNGTRWYRKSDFYTLFLALARKRIDLTKLTAPALREKLVSFSNLVAVGVVDPAHPVSIYKAAVERAATDRARRVRREEALVAFIEGAEVLEDQVSDYLTEDEEAALTTWENISDDEEYQDA
jgi:hypothetical protein